MAEEREELKEKQVQTDSDSTKSDSLKVADIMDDINEEIKEEAKEKLKDKIIEKKKEIEKTKHILKKLEKQYQELLDKDLYELYYDEEW